MGLIQHADIKHIALVQLIQVGKHPCSRKARMTGQDAMRTDAADRQGCAEQVSDALIQRFLGGAVVYGQLHADLRNLDVAHDPVAAYIQKTPVALLGFRQRFTGKRVFGSALQGSVVQDSLFLLCDQFHGVQLFHGLIVTGLDNAPVLFANDIAHKRIQRDAQCQDNANSKDQDFYSSVHSTSIDAGKLH